MKNFTEKINKIENKKIRIAVKLLAAVQLFVLVPCLMVLVGFSLHEKLLVMLGYATLVESFYQGALVYDDDRNCGKAEEYTSALDLFYDTEAILDIYLTKYGAIMKRIFVRIIIALVLILLDTWGVISLYRLCVEERI